MARETNNLHLNVWDEVDDTFNHNELAENWDAVDSHDHSPNKGAQITTQGIADRAIVNQHIAAGAIQDNVIADRAIKSQKIDYDAVRSENIAAGNVTSTKFGLLSTCRVWRANPSLVRVPYGNPATDVVFDRVSWDQRSAVVGLGSTAKHWKNTGTPDDAFIYFLEAGLYLVTAHVAIGPSDQGQHQNTPTDPPADGGVRELRIVDDDGSSYARSSGWGTINVDTVSLSATTIHPFGPGDKIKMQVWQSQTYQTGTTNIHCPYVVAAPDYSPQLAIAWLGPAPSLTS